MLAGLGVGARDVRSPAGLDGIDGLIIPGGESTTIAMGMKAAGLDDAVRREVDAGLPLLGTCAGMILADRDHLGLIDARARRNAFGRQLASFEADVTVDGLGPDPLRAVFIRAPWIDDFGPGVSVLAEHDGHPVVIREGNVLACAFHPELTDDARLHALFMALVPDAPRLEAERNS